MILKVLSRAPQSPKQVALKLNTTIANASQQLKLLEAYGYIKKTKLDKGPGSRQKKDARIVYSINKNKAWLVYLNPSQAIKKEIRQTPENILLQNLIALDIKEQMHLLKWSFSFQPDNFFSTIDALFFLRKEEKAKETEIHLLIISSDVERFRHDKSSKEISLGEKVVKLKFWSHTFEEITLGLERQEKYFENLMSGADLLYEKSLNFSTKLYGDN